MGNSGSTSSDLAKGKKFLKKVLYVQHVDEEKDMVSEIPDRYVEEYLLADRNIFHDSNITKYLASPKENLSILKSSMRDRITEVTVYSNPLPIPVLPENDVTIHAFVVIETERYSHGNFKKTWWSLEKNGQHIVLQQSPNQDDVITKIYDTKKRKSIERIGLVEELETELQWKDSVEDLLRNIWDTNQISERYNVWTSNCQHFTSFIFEKLTGKKWSTTIVDRIGFQNKEIQPRIQVDAVKYQSIVKDDKFDFYRAMMEGRRKDFKKLKNDLTNECLNSVDSQGYTLLEWATVFSSSHWPIDKELKKKGAKIPSDEEGLNIFRRNVFFIALQYLPQNKKLLSFDGIDIHGVNGTGDTSLHLALYGGKWGKTGKILNRFEDYDVNITNSFGDTPLHLATKLECEKGLFTKILKRTNKENVNAQDRNGWTALHYAIDKESENKVKELLAHKDVDVNVKNNTNKKALHLASKWEDMPLDLFKTIKKKIKKNRRIQDENGKTALHYKISKESETVTNELPKRKIQTSTSGSSDVAKERQKLLYVQHVDKEKDTVSEIPERYLKEFLKVDFHGSNFTEYLKSPKENLSILKSSMGDRIRKVTVCSYPLPISLMFLNLIPAFVVFETENYLNGNKKRRSRKTMYWSLEKYGKYIVLQQSLEKDDVINKIYDTEQRRSVERQRRPVMELEKAMGNFTTIEDLLRAIWKYNKKINTISDSYHLYRYFYSQTFASFIFGNTTGEKWTPLVSAAIVNRLGLKKKKIQPKIKVDNVKYKFILNDDIFDCCKALMEGRMEDYEELTNNLTIETINSVDSQGYTLLEWATVFSSSHWPIDEELKKKGAEIPSDQRIFRRNVFFIALQYLPSTEKSKFLSFKGIDIHGMNKTGDTSLHLALYGEKWKIAGDILKKFEDDIVNLTNSLGDTPLHLAAKFNCEIGLFKQILNRTNSWNVNKTDGNGWTALHYAIDNKFEPAVKKLITRRDVDVDIKNNDNGTALHYACWWTDIPVNLFKIILEKSADVNAQEKDGSTSLHSAIQYKSKIALKELLNNKNVDFLIKDKNNRTALHLASKWKDIPSDLFNIIKDKSPNQAARDKEVSPFSCQLS